MAVANRVASVAGWPIEPFRATVCVGHRYGLSGLCDSGYVRAESNWGSVGGRGVKDVVKVGSQQEDGPLGGLLPQLLLILLHQKSLTIAHPDHAVGNAVPSELIQETQRLHDAESEVLEREQVPQLLERGRPVNRDDVVAARPEEEGCG